MSDLLTLYTGRRDRVAADLVKLLATTIDELHTLAGELEHAPRAHHADRILRFLRAPVQAAQELERYQAQIEAIEAYEREASYTNGL